MLTRVRAESAIADFIKVLELCGNNASLCLDAQHRLDNLKDK